MEITRILFSVDDFKTHQWAEELKKYNCEVIPAGTRLYSHLEIILSGFFRNRKIRTFIFRYLNDRKSLSRSLKFFMRDFLIIIVCKILGVRILWLMHNIDEETHHNFPLLSRLRRKLVYNASEKVLVTDPHLVEIAHQHGFKKNKLDWICFGAPAMNGPDQRNEELKKEIQAFRKSLYNNGNSKVYLGLCVSDSLKKKAHYLYADLIVGKSEEHYDSVVGLVIIGKYPEGREFELARVKAMASPYILVIDESFPVNEPFIADQIDFFYRSLTDQSIAYTVYVAASIEKPMITHNTGALPLIVDREQLGYIIQDNEGDIPGTIVQAITSWHSGTAKQFLANRSWNIGAKKLMNAVKTHPV